MKDLHPKPEANEHLAHFAQEISPAIKHYVENVVFRSRRYIFTYREGRHQYGYCTHCHVRFKTQSAFAQSALRHDTKATCPTCDSICIVKSSGRGRNRLIDKAYFIYYEKSKINPQAIVARGIYAVRDYAGNYRDVETKYLVKAWYIFEPGRCIMLKQGGGYDEFTHGLYAYGFKQCSSVYSLVTQQSNNGFGGRNNTIIICAFDSIEDAVAGTPFQYSTWERYVANDDMISFFSLYTKYPCIEYLTKLGLIQLVVDKINKNNGYRAVYWRGKSLAKVLRLDKRDIKELRSCSREVDSLFLKYMQLAKAEGSKFTMQEMVDMSKHFHNHYYELVMILRKRATLRQIYSYVRRQYNRQRKDKVYNNISNALSDWRDYITDCEKLRLDLTQENILFPSDLHKAHQETMKQIKLNENKVHNKKISARAKKLVAKYGFTWCGLLIRPATSALELIEEGKALEHCVGRYIDRYANGETDIFFIRKATEPDVPYYTVEVRKESIVQCRGKKNCGMNEEVSFFVEEFEVAKLGKTKIRTRITVPA